MMMTMTASSYEDVSSFPSVTLSLDSTVTIKKIYFQISDLSTWGMGAGENVISKILNTGSLKLCSN